MNDTVQSGPEQRGDRSGSTTNYAAPRHGWKDTAVIVTLTLNIMFLLGTVFGGMNWVTQVNSNLAIIQSRQEFVLKAIKDIQDHDEQTIRRHAIEDALDPTRAKLFKESISSARP